MRALLLTALFVLTFVIAPVPLPQPMELPKLPEEPSPGRDLRLLAEPVNGRTIRVGERPSLTFTLVNTSNSFSYPVVQPGAGSVDGRDEPTFYFTAQGVITRLGRVDTMH